MTELFEDPLQLMSLILSICSVGTAIGAAEWIALKKHLSDKGLFSWEISKVAVLEDSSAWKSILTDSILKYPNVLLILYIKIALSVFTVFLFGMPKVQGILALCIAVCYFLITYRRANGFNGGDSMAKILMLTCGLCLITQNSEIIKLGLYFIAFQIILAYVTPGILRIKDKDWLNGIKLMRILRTETFSRQPIYSFFKAHPSFAAVVSFSLVTFECAFLIAVLLPVKVLWILLIFGALFHILNAIVMGLNTFVWSFIGAYPALIWTTMELKKYQLLPCAILDHIPHLAVLVHF